MSPGAILALSLALAMDATAVAAARGVAAPTVRLRNALLVAVMFGSAQALMPLLGWAVGSRLGPWVSAWDHWIAFVLLGGIGAKMLWDGRGGAAREPQSDRGDPFGLRLVSVLAFATSIDAFAVGVTLPMLSAPLVLTVTAIGLTTAILCGAAVFLGRRFGALFGPRLDVLGGLVLIAIGLKILVDHLRSG